MAITSTVFVDGVQSNIFPESGILVIRESMDYLVPSGSIAFRDYLATFINRYPIMQDTEISVFFDDDESNTELKHTFYAFSDVKDQVDTAAVDSYAYNLNLMSKYADVLLGDSEFHSSRCRASDYAKYIAEKCGLGYEIEDTKDVLSWINPNWKYGNMLRFLAERSVSASGSLGYMFYVRGDGILVFKSIDALFDEGEGEKVNIKLDGQESDRDLSIRNKLYSNVLLGVNSFYPSYYDLNTSKIVEIDAKFNSYLKKRGVRMGVSRRLADKGESKYYGEFYKEFIDGGIPPRIYKGIYRNVMFQADSTQFVVTVPANLTRKIGDVINLSIPARDPETGGVSFNYSGRYLLKSLVTMGHGDYFQRLHLTRGGINLDDKRKTKYL